MRLFVLIAFGLIGQALISQERLSEGAIVVDYVAELEAAADKLLKKVSDLEEQLQRCMHGRETSLCKEELQRARDEVSQCRAQISRAEKSAGSLRISSRMLESEVANPELREFVRLLVADIERTRQSVQASSDPATREQLFDELDSIERKVLSSQSFKNLAEARVLISRVKKSLK